MKKLFFLLCCSLLTSNTFAWERNISLGYGISNDPNHGKYTNSGFLLASDFFPIHRSEHLFWTVNGSLGQWHTNAPIYKNLTTAAVSAALRAYPFPHSQAPFYGLISVGPSYISSKQFGENQQAGNFAFQTTAGLGIEFAKSWDVNLRAVHYSNAYLDHPNEGYNILYMLSLGYLF